MILNRCFLKTEAFPSGRNRKGHSDLTRLKKDRETKTLEPPSHVGCPSVSNEYVLLLLVTEDTVSANGLVE